MLGPILLGIVAAAFATLPFEVVFLLESRFQGFSAASPIFILGVTGVAMLLQRFLLDRRAGARAYDGVADLFIHIHSVANPDSALRWLVRGINSLLLAVFGGTVGIEGAAAELTHSIAIRTRIRSSFRFEQRRRSDAAVALSGAISAAFGAPFAAVLVPIELGIGGPILPSVSASLAAYLTSRFFISRVLPNGFFHFDGALVGFQANWISWIGILVVAIMAGVIGAALTYFIRYTRENLLDLFQTEAWMRTLTAGVLIFFVAVIYKPGHMLPGFLLERVLWSRISVGELGVLFLTSGMTLGLVLAGFGSIGVFWPILVLGAVTGSGVNHWVLRDLPGLTAAASLAGAAGLWGAVFGTPIAVGVLIWELTGSVQALVIGLLAAILARFVFRFLKTPGLIDKQLESRGMALIDGRSASILSSIYVRDAMMADHESVHENEPVSEIYTRLLRSKYPFLPVTTAQGRYKGLLTIDMVQEAWQNQEQAVLKNSNPTLVRLLEAKDLLYRAGTKTPHVRASDRLSVTAGLFDETPCIPVLTEDSRVAGLLFVYNVRLAYDREVARRALAIQIEPQ